MNFIIAQNNLRKNEKNIFFNVDGLVLAGTLHDPGIKNPPMVVGCHGLFADRMSPKQVALARAVCKKGIAFFRLDHRGCGQSQGDFKKVTTLSGRCADLLGAIAMLREKGLASQKVALFGSSMGGAVCLYAAQKTPVDCIVTNAAPVKFNPVFDILKAHGQDHLLSHEFYEENPCLDAPGALPLSGLLIFHGQKDETIPVSHAHELFDMALEPKKKIIFKNGDHSMSDPKNQKIFVTESVKWYEKHL